MPPVVDLPVLFAAMSLLAGAILCGLAAALPSTAGQRLAAQARRMVANRPVRVPAAAAGDDAMAASSEAHMTLYWRLYRFLRLEPQAEDGGVLSRLRMAGYRGRAPIAAFLVSRALCPIAFGAVAFLYVFVVLALPYPFPAKSALVLAASLAGYYAPGVFLRNRILKRQASIREAWPDALDLLLICIGAGMSVEMALRRVAGEIGGQSKALGEEFELVTAELAYVSDRHAVYEAMANRTGLDEVRAATLALIQADQHGASLGDTIRVLAQESRDARMTEAERRANALPPKLTVPMIVFFLPVLLAVVVTPALIQVMGLM